MARGASYLIIQAIANSVISLVAFAVIARVITRDDMGSLAVLMLVSSAAQLIAGLGVGSTATQFVASLEGRGEHENASSAAYSCFVINAAMTALVVSVMFFSANSLGLFLLGSASKGTLFRLLTLDTAATVDYSLGNLLIGRKLFREFSIASTVSFAARQSAVVALLLLGMGVPGILIGWTIGDSLNSILLAVFARRALGPFRIGFGYVKLLKFSAPLFFGEAASSLWTWFDRALLLPFVSLAQLGAYNVAVTAYGILNAVPSSFSSALFPFYSHLYGDGVTTSGTQDLESAVKTASRYLSFLTIPLAIGLAVTSFPTATLLAGTAYADSAYPLAVLSIFLAIACFARAISQIFVVMGRTVTSAIVTTASVIFPVVLGFIMIPHLGIIGASIAKGASLIIALVLSVLILKRFLKLRFDTLAYGTAWIAGVAMAVVVLILEFAFYSKYLLPVYAAAGAVVFMLVLRLSRAINQDDVVLVSEFLGPRFGFISRWLRAILGVKMESRVPS